METTATVEEISLPEPEKTPISEEIISDIIGAKNETSMPSDTDDIKEDVEMHTFSDDNDNVNGICFYDDGSFLSVFSNFRTTIIQISVVMKIFQPAMMNTIQKILMLMKRNLQNVPEIKLPYQRTRS